MVLAASPGAARAGAWITPLDHGYVKVAAGFSSTRDRYDFAGERVRLDRTEYTESAGALYVALGLAERLELNVATTIKSAELDAPGGTTTTSGVGDLVAGLKVGLFEYPYVQSVQVGVKVPTGYDDTIDPPLGDGQIDVEGRLLTGASLWSLGIPAYLGLEGGYRHREGTPVDELFFLGEAGADLTRDFGVRVKIDGNYARDIPPDDERATDLFAMSKRVTRLDSAIYFEVLERTFLEIGYIHVLSARNFTGGDGWNVGIARKIELGS